MSTHLHAHPSRPSTSLLSRPRASLFPPTSTTNTTTTTITNTNTSTSTSHRNRQYAHLSAQLAQLNAQLADMENLVRMTAVQAEYVRGLGGWSGGLFMASSKVLGEETATGTGGATGGWGRGDEDVD